MSNWLACRKGWIGLVCVVAVVSCSDDEGTAPAADVPQDAVGIDIQWSADKGANTDLGNNDVDPFPGQGDPCGGPGDCDSGWCVESPDGQVCTSTCTASCPDGWECREVISASGDPIYICISLLARLCHPCNLDEDCSEAGSGGSNRCISYVPDGSFCGIQCMGVDQKCPENYLCDSTFDIPQCVPSTGECTCNGLALKLSLSTDCSQSNEIGVCDGARVCQVQGLTACSASLPDVEECNGIDDNCDGLTDEGLDGGLCELTNALGTCEGILSCANGVKTCVGSEPTEEACNAVDDNCDGVVDEGFPDIDLDGVADCVDDDSDGDGVGDIEDCGPNDPTVYPGAQEVCDGKDNDCNNLIDDEGAEGCTNYYADVDKDTYGADDVQPKCLCEPDAGSFYTVLNDEDCNDLSPNAFPGAPEICNAQDDDCDGEVDEVADLPACEISNGFGTCVGAMACLKGVFICDGQTPLPEQCNGVDDDCNGVADEGMVDSDFDGIADCVDEDDDNDGTKDVLDCEPFNPQIHVDAIETCNGIDENCNGIDDDEGAVGCQWFYQDADKDGFGADNVEARCFCEAQPLIYFTALAAGDCNDISGFSNPDGTEVCNGLDDNCDGQFDEGVASPCGGCNSVCLMEVGGGKQAEFKPDAFNSANVTVTPSGSLMLSGGLNGYYRHIFEGWLDAGTLWEFLVAYVELPGNGSTYLNIRYRSANTLVELALGPWIYFPEQIPPGAFPVTFDLEGHFLEVEIGLATNQANLVPIVDNITVVAEEIP